MSFDQFLNTYVHLWIPKHFRESIKSAVLSGKRFEARPKNAIPPLKWLYLNWSPTLTKARTYNKCGLCDSSISVERKVTNLYEAKMWSQLFYDTLVPFDSASKTEIKRAGYPVNDFLAVNRELFRDLRKLAEMYQLDVGRIRKLDSRCAVAPSLRSLPGGQPLSRVVDKIFYKPKK